MLSMLFILAIIGCAISIYAYITEEKVKKDATFKPACDLSDRISCSRVMLSPYANMFFISNTLVGIIYYALIALLAFFNQTALIFYATVGSCLASSALAYILYFKIKSLCVVCTSIYVINIVMLLLAYKALYV